MKRYLMDDFCQLSILNIYIFTAFAVDKSIILDVFHFQMKNDVFHFQMKNIYKSCDLGYAIGQTNVKASQLFVY